MKIRVQCISHGHYKWRIYHNGAIVDWMECIDHLMRQVRNWVKACN